MSALVFGAVVYYMQIYHFYNEVPVNGTTDVELTLFASGEPEPILYEDFTAIDAESSPIRYRACFKTSMSFPMLTETYEPYEGASPKNAPDWFDCFDAAAIGQEIEAGTALVFTGQRNFEWGIDRVVAITDDGRGYVWHEINDCGDKAYDGSPLGRDCPPRDED
ncbi:hypothetical protein TRP8649_03081 [Pelagimonas phthalicica]|uniref:Histidine kinase n=1 Tax=Pelagimonas phthalicica TaxID=1037362 RepID=A0A238JEX9_9RHOB|nr:DUF6446 family protein [Pelagimonas phthalicica]TDS91903.1 hypothetical protein CLV87_3082 [Pelagimonas phthalicica]SMX28953.1 hypothetical protein TRP8649_03081 [Pelagimonas phthalicica]